MAQDKNGGKLTAPNRAPASKVLAGALSNQRVASALITALGQYSVAAVIIATSTSQTTDFGALQVGDFTVHIPAVAGNSSFRTTTTTGTLGATAVVGDMYMVLRTVNLDSNNTLVPTGGQLEGNKTGDAGQDF